MKEQISACYTASRIRPEMLGVLPPVSVLQHASRRNRGHALLRRPRMMIEVVHAAELLGIDPLEEAPLVFLAEEALHLDLPLGWAQHANGAFHNALLQLTQAQHPKLSCLIALYTALASKKGELWHQREAGSHLAAHLPARSASAVSADSPLDDQPDTALQPDEYSSEKKLLGRRAAGRRGEH